MPFQIAFITSEPRVLDHYFPTESDPDWPSLEPPFTPDDLIAVTALRQKGYTVKAVPWGAPPESLTLYDLVVMRSPWDYSDSEENRVAFFYWLQQLKHSAVNLQNDPGFMLWLLDKRYLSDFEAAGIPVVPSHYTQAGDSVDLSAFFNQYGVLVLKPQISAAARGLFYLSSPDAFETDKPQILEALSTRDYIIQPFLPEIQSHGEWSLIYFNGEYSHSLHKIPSDGHILVQAEKGGRFYYAEPPLSVRHLGDCVLTLLNLAYNQAQSKQKNPISPINAEMVPLYLRLDIIERQTPEGPCPVLSECEGVEPQLFFRGNPGSEVRFLNAIDALITQRKTQSLIL